MIPLPDLATYQGRKAVRALIDPDTLLRIMEGKKA